MDKIKKMKIKLSDLEKEVVAYLSDQEQTDLKGGASQGCPIPTLGCPVGETRDMKNWACHTWECLTYDSSCYSNEGYCEGSGVPCAKTYI